MPSKPERWVLRVDERPRALPSVRAKAGQKGYRPASYRKWAKKVQDELKRIWAGRPPLDGPLGVYIALCKTSFTIWIDPLGDSQRDGLRADIDNNAKAILDCLTQAHIIADDNLVEVIHANFYKPLQEEGES